MAKGKRRYTGKLKFQVVLEALTGEKTSGQIAKAYGVPPTAIGLWKKQFLEHGPEVFEQEAQAGEAAKRIAELEQLVGKKEVEIALLKNFLGQPR